VTVMLTRQQGRGLQDQGVGGKIKVASFKTTAKAKNFGLEAQGVTSLVFEAL